MSAGARPATLLADVRGRDARFFVLAPTQYGASSAQAIDPWIGFDLVLWKDAASGEAFSPAMTEYTQSCFDANGAPFECPPYQRGLPIDYSAEGEWTFVMPDAVAAITADMTDTQIAVEQQRVHMSRPSTRTLTARTCTIGIAIDSRR